MKSSSILPPHADKDWNGTTAESYWPLPAADARLLAADLLIYAGMVDSITADAEVEK